MATLEEVAVLLRHLDSAAIAKVVGVSCTSEQEFDVLLKYVQDNSDHTAIDQLWEQIKQGKSLTEQLDFLAQRPFYHATRLLLETVQNLETNLEIDFSHNRDLSTDARLRAIAILKVSEIDLLLDSGINPLFFKIYQIQLAGRNLLPASPAPDNAKTKALDSFDFTSSRSRDSSPVRKDPKRSLKQSDPKQSDPKQSDPKQSDPKQSDPKQSDPKQSDLKQIDRNESDQKQSDLKPSGLRLSLKQNDHRTSDQEPKSKSKPTYNLRDRVCVDCQSKESHTWRSCKEGPLCNPCACKRWREKNK